MSCNVSEGAERRLKEARNTENASIRLARKYNVPETVSKIMACGDQEYGDVSVYRSRSYGIGVRYKGEVVFHNLGGTINICKFDLDWVDILPRMVKHVENEMRVARAKTTQAYAAAKRIENNFSIG